MIDVERELRDLRRTLAQLIGAIDAVAIPSRTSIRRVQVQAGGAAPTELAPARPDRIRLRVQVASGGPVDIGDSQVTVEGGWRLILDGPPFLDNPPAPSKAAWYATSAVLSVVVVSETIRSTQPD